MKKPFATVAIATLLYASTLEAQVKDTPNLRFNGFGTAGVVYSDEDQADFGAGVLAPDGAGHTRDWSPEVDSRLGLQLTADLTPPAYRHTSSGLGAAARRYLRTHRRVGKHKI